MGRQRTARHRPGLVDVLVNALHLDFAFVRLCDPTGGAAVEIARGSAWQAFPEWLQQYLSVNGRLSRREIVRERVWPFQPEPRVLQSDNVDEFVAVPRIVADPSRS